MATFFTVTGDPNDASLLHHSVRSHAEAQNVVDATERDILDYFTRGVSDTSRFVALEGYNDETPGSSEAGLKADLKYTIGEVASHRLRYLDDDPKATLAVRGARTVGRKAGALDPLWPSGWERRLVKRQTRVSHGIR